MLVQCACGAYRINPEHATYVKDGVPMCHEETCRKVKERRDLGRVPHFDDAAFDVVFDQMPREIYAKGDPP